MIDSIIKAAATAFTMGSKKPPKINKGLKSTTLMVLALFL